jgi:hypothetical protein
MEEEEEDQLGKEKPVEQPLDAPAPSRQSEIMKQRWADPEFRRKVIASKKRSREIEQTGGASLQIAEAQHDNEQPQSDEEEDLLEKEGAAEQTLDAPSPSPPKKKRGRPPLKTPPHDESAQDTASSEPGQRGGLMQRFLEKMKPLPVPNNEDKEKAAEPSLGEPKLSGQSEADSLQRMEAADSKRLREPSSASNDLPVVVVQPTDKSKKNTRHQNKKPSPSDAAPSDSTKPKRTDLFQEYLANWREGKSYRCPAKSSDASRLVVKRSARPRQKISNFWILRHNGTSPATNKSTLTQSQQPVDMLTSPDSLAWARPECQISNRATPFTTAEFTRSQTVCPGKEVDVRDPRSNKEHTLHCGIA